MELSKKFLTSFEKIFYRVYLSIFGKTLDFMMVRIKDPTMPVAMCPNSCRRSLFKARSNHMATYTVIVHTSMGWKQTSEKTKFLMISSLRGGKRIKSEERDPDGIPNIVLKTSILAFPAIFSPHDHKTVTVAQVMLAQEVTVISVQP